MKYTKEQLEVAVKESLSIASVCRKVGIKPKGANYGTIRLKLERFEIDFSHFTGQAWNVGERFREFGKKYPLSEILVENSTYRSNERLKIRLVKEGLKENECEKCGIDSWLSEPLSLHLDHINGDHRDNRIENLRFLCPNCHSQTPTYCRKNKHAPMVKPVNT